MIAEFDIALVCPLRDLNPAYSIAGMVTRQLNLLGKKGFRVLFLTTSDYLNWGELHPNITVKTFDRHYQQKKELFILELSLLFKAYLTGIKKVITHDIAFLPSYAIYLAALEDLAKEGDHQFFHWVHSTPGYDHDTNYPEKLCFEYLPNSKYIFPNESNLEDLCRRFQTTSENILTIYNFLDLDTEGIEWLRYWEYDYICQYPTRVCVGKRIDKWFDYLEELQKQSGKKVLGLLSLAYPDSNNTKELRERMKTTTIDVIVVNDKVNHPSNSVPKKIVDKLNQFCDLFVLSSAGESSSLIWLENGFSKNVVVINTEIKCSKEFGKDNVHYCTFLDPKSIKKSVKELLKFKGLDFFKYVRQTHNEEWIFKNQMLPLMFSNQRDS